MYKVIEVVPVDDVSLEEALNKGAREGYRLDAIKLVQQEGVRRPVMAYIIMIKGDLDEGAPVPGEAPEEG